MKLLMFLMLIALPLYCYAGSGCELLENVILETISPSKTVDQYVNDLQEFISDDDAEQALRNFKQCFLNQSNETLVNAQILMEYVYNSPWCVLY